MRKGQAAMEFLMTYGWAILVVLAAIGALAYFGVLSPDRFLPSKCVATAPFSCGQYKVTSTGLQMDLLNNGGVDVQSVNVSITCGSTSASNTSALSIANGASTSYAFSGCNASSGARFKANYTISYVNSGETLSHTSTGTIQARGE